MEISITIPSISTVLASTCATITNVVPQDTAKPKVDIEAGKFFYNLVITLRYFHVESIKF